MTVSRFDFSHIAGATRDVLSLAICAALAIGGIAEARADIHHVTNNADSGTGSLRQAVIDANADANPPRSVVFDNTVASPITLTTGQIEIANSMTVQGPGPGLTIGANSTSRIFYVHGLNDVTISGLTLTGGYSDPGGGVEIANASLTLQDSVITHNASYSNGSGGGVYVAFGSLYLNRCTLDHNTSLYGGGLGSVNGHITIANSTIIHNSADLGGGIWAKSANLVGPFDIVVRNSTLSGNSAGTFGGAIYVGLGQRGTFADTMTIESSTISGNTSPQGGGIFQAWNTVVLHNTIVANNVAQYYGPDADGYFNADFSLIRDTEHATITGSNNVAGVDPNLGPLINTGGVTLTMRPSNGSPAIDKGEAAGAPSIDQRGLPRPAGAKNDIGAVEVQVFEDIIFRDGFDS